LSKTVQYYNEFSSKTKYTSIITKQKPNYAPAPKQIKPVISGFILKSFKNKKKTGIITKSHSDIVQKYFPNIVR